MPSLRVCAITFDWYPFDVLVRRTAEAAASAGYISEVICTRKPGQGIEEVCDGVQVHRIPMSRSFGRSLPFTVLEWIIFLVRAGIKVTQLHLKHKYDVIHVHNMPDFLVFAALIPKLLGAKVVLEIQDVSPELMAVKAKAKLRRLAALLATWQERISVLFADHIITVGWPFEQLLLKRGVPARNRLDVVVRAVAKARQVAPYIRLDVKGRGEAIPSVKLLAQDLGMGEHVIFSDVCPPGDELNDFLLHGDVGIIPYPSDGFMDLLLPTKAYEYAWMRRPMIVSDTPGMRSMFRPEAIMLCEPDNVDSFAAAIIELYQHPEKRQSMVDEAAKDYIPYRWEIMAERYQELLLTLAKKERKEGKVQVETTSI